MGQKRLMSRQRHCQWIVALHTHLIICRELWLCSQRTPSVYKLVLVQSETRHLARNWLIYHKSLLDRVPAALAISLYQSQQDCIISAHAYPPILIQLTHSG